MKSETQSSQASEEKDDSSNFFVLEATNHDLETEPRTENGDVLNEKQLGQTNLNYFKANQNFHCPIKRDLVEQKFKEDIEIFRITKNFKTTLKWLCDKGLLPAERDCPVCRQPLRLANVLTKVKDGLLFKCTRLECRDIKVSIRESTIFDGSHMTFMEILRIIFYYFVRGFNALQTF